MAEQVNPNDSSTDTNPAGSGEPSVEDQVVKKGSDNSNSDQGKRKLQSERDQLREENKKLVQDVEELKGVVYGDQVNKVLKDFVKNNKEKYPDVTADDLASAGSVDELDEVAKKAQGRYDRVRNDALRKVQDVPDVTMTEQEKAEALKKLEKSENNANQSKFSQFLTIKRTKTK